jgi:FkbH-like protein
MLEGLYWLPEVQDWQTHIAKLRAGDGDAQTLIKGLANCKLDFVRTNALDTLIRQSRTSTSGLRSSPRTIRLAVLGSATLSHLLPAIRVGAARRGLSVECYEGPYGQHVQELLDTGSGLHAFKPDYVLFAFDARHLTHRFKEDAPLSAIMDELREGWNRAKDALGCRVLQQTAAPIFPAVLGENEQRIAGSRADLVRRLNEALRGAADEADVDLVALDTWMGRTGIDAWYDAKYWYLAKQEVKLSAAPLYGDLVGRLLAARMGLARKVLVLDLDNTLWGGVLGDDGIDGIQIGNGNALSEAFLDVQHYAKELSKRGVVLAISSKNDMKNVVEAFEKHPEMVLRMSDFAAVACNWDPKPDNLRALAQQLNLGLDSFVFLDDNPFERNLVRAELPMVAVPEISDDPSTYTQTLSDAGYFEAAYLSEEDRARAAQYQANLARDALRTQATDLDGYLRSMEMRLLWSRVDGSNLKRPTQLLNKTNQFNLTTRRRTEQEMADFVGADKALALQFRLTDRFGDNGIIALVLGEMRGEVMYLDSWLMSCRVLGRQVEAGMLNFVAQTARAMGASKLHGEYRPTAKNGMVEQHYPKLGFEAFQPQPALSKPTAAGHYVLDLNAFTPIPTFLITQEEKLK